MSLPTAGCGGFGLISDLGDGTVVKTARKTQRAAAEALVREAAALQALRDVEGVIDPLAWGYDEEGPWLKLPKITSDTLAEADMPWPLNLAFFLLVAQTVDACHARGILHRDIKPENIFVTHNGPLLIDFGLAYIQGQPDLTGQNTYVYGTPQIMPPEVIRDPAVKPHPIQDAWQLGMLLHQMSEGEWAVEEASATTVMMDVCRGRIEPIRPELRRARHLFLTERNIRSGCDEVTEVMLREIGVDGSKLREALARG